MFEVIRSSSMLRGDVVANERLKWVCGILKWVVNTLLDPVFGKIKFYVALAMVALIFFVPILY